MRKIDIDKLSKILLELKLVGNNIVDRYNCESLYKTKDAESVRVIQVSGNWFISSNIGK